MDIRFETWHVKGLCRSFHWNRWINKICQILWEYVKSDGAVVILNQRTIIHSKVGLWMLIITQRQSFFLNKVMASAVTSLESVSGTKRPFVWYSCYKCAFTIRGQIRWYKGQLLWGTGACIWSIFKISREHFVMIFRCRCG